jgi:translation elongation factor EF-Tu-like GTPase
MNETDFIADLTYNTTENGGRKTAANSGYRPQVEFEFTKYTSSGKQTFIGQDSVSPGESVSAKISLLSPELFEKQLEIGTQFKITEGKHIIGLGKITEIINIKLTKTN